MNKKNLKLGLILTVFEVILNGCPQVEGFYKRSFMQCQGVTNTSHFNAFSCHAYTQFRVFTDTTLDYVSYNIKLSDSNPYINI